jgi:CheY-like chemotaxis protein
MAKKKIGEILLEKNLITADNLDQALRKQKTMLKPIGRILEDMDVVLEEDIAEGLSLQFNIPYLRKISHHEISPETLAAVDAGYALAKLVFPLRRDHQTLYLAVANPLDMSVQSELAFLTEMRISICVATPAEIKAVIRKFYGMEPQSIVKRNNETVLHIDSQEAVLKAARKVLDDHGIEGYQAHDGFEGLIMAIDLCPQLIVTDIILPRLDGKSLFRALGEHRETSRIPVIALSSNGSPEEESQIFKAGFFDFIAKPFEKHRFLARVKRGLRYAEHASFL